MSGVGSAEDKMCRVFASQPSPPGVPSTTAATLQPLREILLQPTRFPAVSLESDATVSRARHSVLKPSVDIQQMVAS